MHKHTHLQAAQALTQTKACKRVCFSAPRKTKNLPSFKNKTLLTHSPSYKNETIEQAGNINGMSLEKKVGLLVTGGCCQWRGSASYDTDVHIETVVLRGKFSNEPPNSTPPNRWAQLNGALNK